MQDVYKYKCDAPLKLGGMPCLHFSALPGGHFSIEHNFENLWSKAENQLSTWGMR